MARSVNHHALNHSVVLRSHCSLCLDFLPAFRFVESGNVFIFQVDTDGVVTAWNAAAERLSGYSKSEAVGRPFVSFVAGDTSHLALVVTSRVDNFNTKDVGFTLRTHDGRLVRMTVNVMPRYNLVGNVVGNVGVAMDITDRYAPPPFLQEKI